MIPNVTRGDRMPGLIGYLVGPGRHNEHTEPHLIDGDGWLMAWHSGDSLDAHSAQQIARHLDAPRRRNDVEVPRGHVWHCSLSLRAEEGSLSDEQWSGIARDFVAAMEFDDCQGSKEPCRWVAIHHGASQGGNDHIHIAVDLVRPDGTKADVFRDFRRAQSACRALEKKWGLEQLESAREQRSTRGVKAGEIEAQARRVARAKWRRRPDVKDGAEPRWEDLPRDRRADLIGAERAAASARHDLGVTVRGAAAAADDEAAFVRNLREAGVLARPRYADGRRDVVTGYSVALKPQAGERPIWYGGGRLAHDLTLSRLRTDWPDTAQSASEAVAQWNAAKKHQPTGRSQRPPAMDPSQWGRCADQIAGLVDQLASVPLTDRDRWAATSRQAAGVLAAWSQATERGQGPLGRAAEVVSRSGQTWQPSGPGVAGSGQVMRGAAMAMAAAARGGQGVVAQVAMMRQMMTLVVALAAAARAGSQARQAEALATVARTDLAAVHRSLDQAANRVTVPGPVTEQERPPAPGEQEAAERIEEAQPGPSMPPQARPGQPGRSMRELAFGKPATEAARRPPPDIGHGRTRPPRPDRDRGHERG